MFNRSLLLAAVLLPLLALGCSDNLIDAPPIDVPRDPGGPGDPPGPGRPPINVDYSGLRYEYEGGPSVGLVDMIVRGEGETLYLASRQAGIFRSDGGSHWEPFNEGIRFNSAVWPAHGFISVAASPDGWAIAYQQNDGYYRSYRGGPWQRFEGLPTPDIFFVSFALSEGGLFFASVYNHGVFRSENAGERWSRIDDIPASMLQHTMVVTPTGALVLGDREFSDRPGFFVSTDGGVTFTVRTGAPRGLSAMSSLDDGSIIGYGSLGFLRKLYRSSDLGLTWTEIPLQVSNTIYATATWGNSIAVDLRAQIAVSRDGGQTMTYYPMNGAHARCVGFMPDGSLYVCTSDRLVKLDEGSGTWHPIGPTTEGSKITIAKGSDGREFLSVWRTGLFSRDAGDEWKSRYTDEMTACTMFASRPGTVMCAGSGQTLRSADNGHTWTTGGGGPWSRQIVQTGDGSLYSWNYATLFRSDDDGRTWQQTTGHASVGVITGLAVDHTGNLLIAGNGLFSLVGSELVLLRPGAHWAVAVNSYGDIFAGGTGFLVQRVFGETEWKAVKTVPGMRVVQAYVDDEDGVFLVLNKIQSSSFVDAEGFEGGLYVSGDNGVSWLRIASPAVARAIPQSIVQTGRRQYLVSNDWGLWRLER